MRSEIELSENIPAGIVVAEAPSGRIVLFNPQAEKVLGHPALPTPDFDSYKQWPAYHPDGRRFESDEYTTVRALRGEVVRDKEFLYPRKDGTLRWVRANAAPIHGSDGEVQGAVSLIQDIDAEKQAEEALLRSRERLNLAQKAARIGPLRVEDPDRREHLVRRAGGPLRGASGRL